MKKFKQEFKVKPVVRNIEASINNIDVEKRTIQISFSSEEPYPRNFGFECLEVIGHDEGDMDLTRLNNKAALLFNHDFDMLIGVVEKAWIENKRGYALIRLSETAWQYAKMLEEGILTKVSFGYEITEMIQIGERDGYPIVKVKTAPYEISLVSVPADDTVGFGRISNIQEKTFEVEIELEENEEEKKKSEEEVNQSEDEMKKSEDVINETEEELKKEEEIFDNKEQILENKTITIIKKENNMDRTKEILDLGRKYSELELAVDFVNAGKSFEDFQLALIEKKASSASKLDSGTQKELSKFSFAKYIEEQLDKTNGQMTGLAKEISQDFYKSGYKGNGGIILPRNLVTEMRISAARASGSYLLGTAAAGGNTASEDYRNQIIDALYANSVWNGLSTVMPSATGYGSVSYPLINSKNNVQMLGEGTGATASRAGFDKVTFTPKTAKGTAKLTRELLKTSSLANIEAFAMGALMKATDEKRNQQWLNGTGADGEVRGIFNVSGVASVAHGTDGGALTFAKVVEFETAVASSNADVSRNAYVTNSKVAGAMKVTQKFPNYGVEVLVNGMANGYPVFVTNEVKSDYTKASGTGLSGMAYVNPSYIHVIEWDGVEFLVNPFIEGDGAVRIEGFDTFDMQVSRPETISVSKDILA